ncbi:MAG: glycosyltransferase family 39 protein [Chloroflexi bacterium]|nr:glycosyltransferase family 39 protein [Chloroflexota bacterium]
MTQHARHLSILVLILLLAAATRITNVGSWPLWTDEGWSIWATDGSQLDVVFDNLAHDRHPPLYFAALWGWRSLAGDSPLALRYISIAAGLLTVAVAYRIGADVFSRRAGLYAALLLAVLPIAVYYSQEVRHYGAFVLFVLLSWLCFLRFQKYPTFGKWLGYILGLTAAFYTLYFAVLPLAVQVVVGLVWGWRLRNTGTHPRYKKPFFWLIGAWVVTAVLYLPWLWVIATIQFPTLTTGIGNLPGTYAATLANIPPLGELLLSTQWALLLGLGALAVWAIYNTSTQPEFRRDGIHAVRLPQQGAVVLGGVGLLVAMFILSYRFNLLSGRTLVFLVPMLVVVCGYGASLLETPRHEGWRRTEPAKVADVGEGVRVQPLSPSRLVTPANLLLGAWLLVTLASPTVIQPRIDSDTAAGIVAEDYAAGDLIVLETGWDDNAFAYQLRRVLPEAEIVRTITRADIYSDQKDLLPALMPQLDSHRRVWVVQWLQAPQIMNALDSGTAGYQPVIRRELPVNADYRQRFGDSVIQMVLYEKPILDAQSWQFGDLFTLRDALAPTQAHTGERLPIDLWWSVTAQPTLDYSVGVFLLDSSGAVRVDHNGAPSDKPTTIWTADDLYFDRHTLTLPPDLPAGRYSLVVKVYWYGDNEALPVDGQPFATIGEIEVQ